MAEKKKWIKGATANAHGQFAAKADRAGKTTREFATEEADAPGKLGKQARLAQTLMGMHGNRADRMYSPKKVKRG